MTDTEMMNFLDDAKKIEFEYHPYTTNYKGLGELENATCVHGYDKNNKLSFYAVFDAFDNWKLDLYKEQCRYSFSNSDADDITLSPTQLKDIKIASYFINRLKYIDKSRKLQQQIIAQKTSSLPSNNVSHSQHTPTLEEDLEKGINVLLSDKKRLSFASDIETLTIKKDKDGVLRIKGTSEDGKQSIDFTYNNKQIELAIVNGNTARKYDNYKFGNKFTYRDLKSPTFTHYDGDEGESYSREMTSIMDELKAKHQQRNQQNINIPPRYLKPKTL